jgi:MFS family permease
MLIVTLVREQHRAPAGGKPPGVAANIREMLAIPALRWMLVVVALSQSGMMLINPQISLFLKDLVRNPAAVNRAVGLVIAAPALSSFLMATNWGRLGDQRGHAAVLGLALILAGIVIPWAWLATAVWQVFVIRLLMGAFTSAMNPSTHSAVAHCVPEQRTASAFSLLSSAQMLGSCAGPFLSGPLALSLGVRPLFPMTGLLLVLAGLASLRASALRGKSQAAGPAV